MHEDQSTGEAVSCARQIWIPISHPLVPDSTRIHDVVGYNPQLLLTDERGTVQHSAYEQVLAFRRVYPQITDTYRKWVAEGMQLVPAVNGVFGQVNGRNIQGRDPEMIEAIMPRQTAEAVVLGTGRLVFDPPIQRIRQEKVSQVFVLDLETDFSAIEERILRTLNLKRETAKRQMMMYALGTMAFEDEFSLTRKRKPTFAAVEDFDDEPTKQNGRSASYLKHDKTKNHKRRKWK